MYNYWVDWEEFNLIKDFVQPQDQVADVGTNMGFYTIWFSKFINETGKIHCFEPDEANFRKLEDNCRLNQLQNVCLNNIAVGNQSGIVSFTLGLDGENHIASEEDKNTQTVLITKLDDYCEKNNIHQLAYAKVDIEGFEFDFLAGASVLLSQKRIDIIQIEINEQIRHSGKTIDELLRLIQESGYQLCKYDTEVKTLYPVQYQPERENYFLVADLIRANASIKQNNFIYNLPTHQPTPSQI